MCSPVGGGAGVARQAKATGVSLSERRKCQQLSGHPGRHGDCVGRRLCERMDAFLTGTHQ